jgi:quinol monooxygenase YgiN
VITFITHVRVSMQNSAAYEELMAYVTSQVRASEPDVLYYDFAKSVRERDTYVVIEVYRDQTAHSAHMEADWVKSSIPKSNLLVENANYDIKRYVSPGIESVHERMSQGAFDCLD